MTDKKKAVVSAIALTSMTLAGAAPYAAFADNAAVDTQATQATQQAENAQAQSAFVKADASQGTFTWDQATITPNELIKKVFAKAAAALCGATDDFAQSNPLEWKLSVSGDVDNAFTATVDEMAQDQSVQQVMTCTCGGNPVDGKATITADVKGIPLTYLVSQAKAASDVNAITFVASDGTEVSMPLSYAIGRHGVISYEINGEDLSASVGGNNQLWLAGTSANYFVRDIVEVRIAHEDTLPAIPGEDMAYPNSPNVGLTSASAE